MINMSGLLFQGIAAAVVVGAVTAGYFSWRTVQRDIGAQAQYEVDRAAMEQLKVDARVKLDEATARRDAAEQALVAAKNKQEIADAKNKATNAALATKLATMSASAGGRLRDPNADVGCGGGGGDSTRPPTATAGDSHDDGAETGGLLSVQLSDLLRERLREADEINIAYAACRADALHIRGQ